MTTIGFDAKLLTSTSALLNISAQSLHIHWLLLPDIFNLIAQKTNRKLMCSGLSCDSAKCQLFSFKLVSDFKEGN